jgi:OOP family OmpA-OmpF porin
MSTRRVTALLAGCAFLVSGCASMGSSTLGNTNWTCVIIGGLLGGTAGVVAVNANHGDDEDEERAAGGAAGAVLGAAIGHYVCRRPNQAPTASMSADPRSGEPPLRVQFRGTGHDADGTIKGYAWDFGDGSTSSEQNPSHVYRSAGTYGVTLRVTDDDGLTGSTTGQIQVASARAAAPPESARRIVLRGINFAFDSARIEPEFEPVLDVAVEELQNNPNISVEVSGHTDSTGTDEYNQGLSERRARSVVDYLVRKGIDRGRLEAVGHGESMPVADNATRDGRAQNRRVELNVR